MNRRLSENISGAVLFYIVFAFATLAFFNFSSTSAAQPVETPRYIQIDMPEIFKRFDMPFALFNHEIHSKSTAKSSCEKCHRFRDDGTFGYRVVEFGKKDNAETITNAYHNFCNQCHSEGKQNPMTCKECHSPLKDYKPAQWIARELSLSQHDKMRSFSKSKCVECHHGYTNAKKAKQKKFIFSCRTCHLKDSVGKVRSMADIAHERCVTCHVKALEHTESGGPTECVPCHIDEKNSSLESVDDMSNVKRLEAGQKDVVFIHSKGATKPGVSFDHKDHEKNIRSCRTCHHKDNQACSVCHTLSGSKDGGNLPLPEAFMEQNSQRSCIGCHERQKKEKNCAYCHSTMAARFSEDSCPVCHTGRKVADKDDKRLKQKSVNGLPASLPDVFVVGKGVKDFEPVEFPHAKIIRTLSDGIAKSHLATVFHSGKNVVCGKCHHKSNRKSTNEKCSTCHPATADKNKKGIVPVSMALKTLCAECHTGKQKAR